MTATCPIHGLEMKFVPAGISRKTQKAYNAFYGCPERSCKETVPAPNAPSVTSPKPLTNISEEEPMRNEDWARKEFIKGFAVFTSNERQQGMSPVDLIKSSHTFDYMFVAYGDSPYYADWAKGVMGRIKKLAESEINDIHEAFDKEVERKAATEDESDSEETISK